MIQVNSRPCDLKREAAAAERIHSSHHHKNLNVWVCQKVMTWMKMWFTFWKRYSSLENPDFPGTEQKHFRENSLTTLTQVPLPENLQI